jgi:SCY1-like protein 1
MSEKIKTTYLLPSFARSLRDPFVHSRISVLKSLTATKDLFSYQEKSNKIIPILSPCLLDQDKTVRESSFTCLKLFLKDLEKFAFSDDFDKEIEKIEKEKEGDKESGYFNWAITSVTNLKNKITGGSNVQEENNEKEGKKIGEMIQNNMKTTIQEEKEEIDEDFFKEKDEILDKKTKYQNEKIKKKEQYQLKKNKNISNNNIINKKNNDDDDFMNFNEKNKKNNKQNNIDDDDDFMNFNEKNKNISNKNNNNNDDNDDFINFNEKNKKIKNEEKKKKNNENFNKKI